MAVPVGLGRVVDPVGVLPQAARVLDASPEIGADEVRIRVERLNLDAASFRQLSEKHGGDGEAVRAEVLEIIGTRGKMHNPVTGSGGMLIGVVDEVGPESPLPVKAGDRVATLVSLTLTPLRITDGLRGWDGMSRAGPGGRARDPVRPVGGRGAARRPAAGAGPGGVRRVRGAGADRPGRRGVPGCGAGRGRPEQVTVAVLGGAGKSGSLALTAARLAGARTAGIVVSDAERDTLTRAGLADHVAVADARDPVAVSSAVTGALGGPATVTVVCVDVPGCEHGAILSTRDGGTVIFFSMATSFAGGRAGRGGPGRGRDDAGRQRLRAGARGVRGGSGAQGPGCARVVRVADRGTLTGMTIHPPTLYQGGRFYSAADPRATAMLVRDGRIAWLGADADAPSADVTVDLGRCAGHAGVRGRASARHRHRPGVRRARSVRRAVGRASCWTRWRRSRRPARPVGWCTGMAGTSRPGRIRPRRRPEVLERAAGGRRVYLSQASVHSALCSTSLLAAAEGVEGTTRRAGCGSRRITRYGRWRSAR